MSGGMRKSRFLVSPFKEERFFFSRFLYRTQYSRQPHDFTIVSLLSLFFAQFSS